MGFKSKVFGFLATAALTLSMGAGIASAQTSAGTAILNEGACKLTLGGDNPLDYGTYVWDGTAYEQTVGNGTATLILDVDTPKAKDCLISNTSTGLHLDGNTSYGNSGVNHIPSSSFNWAVTGPGVPPGTGDTGSAPVLPAGQGDYTLTLTMTDPVSTLTPGAYWGTLVFDIQPQ